MAARGERSVVTSGATSGIVTTDVAEHDGASGQQINISPPAYAVRASDRRVAVPYAGRASGM
jgi:hypothetical protein